MSETCCKSCSHGDGCTVPVVARITWKVNKARKLARRVTFQGMDVSIETDKGQYRHWYDPHNKTEGKTLMIFPYGYVRRTTGADDEAIDVYVGPNESEDTVYIVHQMKAPDFNDYDEDKIFLGFESARSAKAAYLAHYDNPKFFGSMEEMSVEEFKEEFVSKSIGAAAMAAPIMVFEPAVDTFEHVMELLSHVGSLSEQDLSTLSDVIWGPGHIFQVQSLEDARAEIIGFLLDQRDLFGYMPQPQVV